MPAAPAPRLVRRPPAEDAVPRHWDAAADRVLAHRSGPLRVIGGPGTGKTSLLVEAVAARVHGGLDPERLLVLVGSRRAAADLREQLTARMIAGPAGPEQLELFAPTRGRTTREPLVRTVHSYAFGLLRLHAARRGDAPPRLLAGPEQDAVVRELLAGELAGDVAGSGWPAALRPALGLPGFAAELRELLLRAAERGLGPEGLAALGLRHGVPAWVAAGRFFRSYEQVTLLRGSAGRGAPQATAAALDAAELVAAALDALAADAELLAAERERVRHLVVDDAQDLDPQQLQLVRAIGSAAETFLLAGDPDQAVLGFRGADPIALRDDAGEPVVVLSVDHRAAGVLRAATVGLAQRLPGPGAARRREAPAGPREGGRGQGTLAVRVFASAAQEAGWVADRLRRAHLLDGVPWSQMSVLVRSTNRSLPVLRRALLAAGVPMTVPADELPLSRQPAVLPLLLLLRCAARPEVLDADAAVALLSSPLGAADPMALRRLRRGLLRLQLAGEPVGEPRTGVSSDELLVAALRTAAAGHPDPLPALPARDTEPLRKVGTQLRVATEAAARGEDAEQVLWQVWQASGLAPRWAAASALRGPVGAQADRDLDAVLALFDAAARYADRLPGADVAGFAGYVADQQFAGDSLAPRAPQGEAVGVLTAHAARGREWRVVAVVGVQEGSWPDLRLRGTLLGVERLVDAAAGLEDAVDAPTAGSAGGSGGSGGATGPALSRIAPLLAEERRLFYLACSRARETLLCSAVRGEDEQPSRFLDELEPYQPPPDAPDEARPVRRPPRALVLAELVGELRRAACDSAGPPQVRERAAAQLARLAAADVPGAHPDQWYGLLPTSTDEPLRGPGEVARVSPSQVEKIMKCPLRWALEQHGGDDGAALASVTGSLVHALVQAGAEGAPDVEVEHALREAWAAVDAGAPWFGRRELERVREMLAAFRAWLGTSRQQGLRAVAVEQELELILPAGGDGPEVRLRGRVDRLEVDRAGRPVIVDVKTGKTVVSKDDARDHPQLAVYQLAAALGAFGEVLAGPAPAPGGARLLYLARQTSGRATERTQEPLDIEEVARWRQVVHTTAADSGGAVFVARQGPECDRCGVRASCPITASGRPVTTS